MSELSELRRNARALFDYALQSVAPRPAVKDAVARLNISASKIYSIAIGKAATAMALGLEDALAEQLTAGVSVSTSPLHSQRWQSFIGGHPLPNEESLAAAQAAFALLDRANDEKATVIFLLSGGGSAMLEWPSDNQISLADLRTANQDLISCGARIADVNAVRRTFSAVKGGGLARRSPNAHMFTLIVSDTNPGDEETVASGPTLNVAGDAPAAMDVVSHYHLETVLPESIMTAVRCAREPREKVHGDHIVVLDNQTALNATAAKAGQLGFSSSIQNQICEQPIQEGCDLLLSGLLEKRTHKSFCFVSGGEFSCPVRGDGRGGRNIETVLRCAIRFKEMKDSVGDVVVLSAGTDGIDGNSSAAGAIADDSTIERAEKLKLEAQDFLKRSDSHSFFEPLNDLIVTGPTGTNVRDLRIVLGS